MKLYLYFCKEIETVIMATVRFSVHRNPKKDEAEKDTYQVRHECVYTVNTRELVDHLKYHAIARREMIEPALSVLKDEIIEHVLDNKRLHLDGIGTFYLKIGFRDRVDENGEPMEVSFDDPADITGNDLCVKGIGFTPDADFLRDLLEKPAYFENVTGRGRVGHSVSYTREEMEDRLREYLSANNHITCRDMQRELGLTEYMSRKWLSTLTAEPTPFLKESKVGQVFLYRLA